MKKAHVKRNMKKDLTFFGSCMFFVLVGLHMIFFWEVIETRYGLIEQLFMFGANSQGELVFWGWLSVIFFGVGLVAMIAVGELFRPVATVDENGIVIFLRFRKKQFISWRTVDRMIEDKLMGTSNGVIIITKDAHHKFSTKDTKLKTNEVLRLLHQYKRQFEGKVPKKWD